MDNETNQYDCQIIQDLLPLYKDGVCSAESRKIVEEHLSTCENCRHMKEQLENTVIEDKLITETADVIGKHEKKERRRSATIGMTMAGILMIPLVICLICNLAIGHGLTWFFVVLAALLLAASILVVPFLAQQKRELKTSMAFTASLLLLLLVTAIYSGGTWFPLAAISVILGLSVLLLPFLVSSISFPKVFSQHRGICIMLWNTAWLYLLIWVCSYYPVPENYLRIAMQITTVSIFIPWSMFLIIRYLKISWLEKTGMCMMIAGIAETVMDELIDYIIGDSAALPLSQVNLMSWTDSSIDANVDLLVLAATVILGIYLILRGRKSRMER